MLRLWGRGSSPLAHGEWWCSAHYHLASEGLKKAPSFERGTQISGGADVDLGLKKLYSREETSASERADLQEGI